jgi:hypothetical protein
MVGGITLVFLAAVAFLFWLAGLTGATPAQGKTPAPVATEGT